MVPRQLIRGQLRIDRVDTLGRRVLVYLDQTLILPGSKLYWIARLYSGDLMTGCDADQESMIAAGEKMLAEARANPERKVDEELIAKLHKEISDWRQTVNKP